MSRYKKYKASYQAYYQANKEHIEELRRLWRARNPNYDRTYYLANRKRILLRDLRYRENNREKIREEKRIYREKNRETLLLKKKEFRQNNPLQIKAQNIIRMGMCRGRNDFPLASECELCPEDDKQTENLEHAHFDYNYPTFYVTACKPCHASADRSLRK